MSLGQPASDPGATDAEQMRIEADRCVKCGMCLPECPTYRLSGDESESPRGRIALIEGLVAGALPIDDRLMAHLDSCLLCRRCERICPSQVHYGELVDRVRQHLPKQRAGVMGSTLRHPSLHRLASGVARWVPDGASRPLGPLHVAHRLARALSDRREAPSMGHYPALTEPGRGRIGLFPGCATAVQQGGALQDALLLLRTVGFAVDVPAEHLCCGALAAHQGDRAEAERLAAANRRAFGEGLDAIVSIASGCGVQLDESRHGLPAPHRDITRFLLDAGGLASANFEPLPQRVLLHTPCTVENVYRGGAWARELLTLIPEIEIVAVGEAGQCCGSAGDYMLRQRETAVRLREPIIDQARTADARLLLTSNIGCALHIAEGLGSDCGIEVMHPVQLLARQLVTA